MPNSQQNEDAKVILAQAVQHLPKSVKIWVTAANLEHELKIKKRVLRKGQRIRPPPFEVSL